MDRKTALMLSSCWLLACHPDATESEDGATETSTADESESGSDESGQTETETGENGEDPIDCAALGFDVKPFDASGTEHAFDALVPDFEVETLRGTYSLSASWSGCENHVLIPYAATFASQSIESLIDDGDPNTIYVIYSMAGDDAVAAAEVGSIAAKVEAHVETLGPDAADQWSMRFRYVSESGQQVPLLGFVHGVDTGADFFAIDQFQRLRNAGSGAVAQNDGTWVTQIGHARYAAKFYNYEARLQQRLAAEAAQLGDGLEVVTVQAASWEAETTTNDEGLDGVLTVGFPPAEVMARFDHAEIVVKEDCGHFPGDALSCSGERGIIVSLCAGRPDCLFEGTEDGLETFFKIISGYATGGWWTQDVSHILPALRVGGDIPMRVNWVGAGEGDLQANIQIRLSDRVADTAEDPRAALHLPLFGGSPFNAPYAERMPSYQFTPPPGTTRVMLHTHATGHGGGGNGTCAEFCTLGQHIHVNEVTYDHDWVQESTWDCAARVDQGVTPNQWGTWYFDRSNWCPGWTAETLDLDITDAVDLDGPNVIEWSGSYAGDWPWKGSLHNKPWLTFHGPSDGEATLEIVPKPSCDNVAVTIRDFAQDFADFQPTLDAYDALDGEDPVKEAANGSLTGVVEPQLAELDGVWKPVFAWPADTLPYTSAANFDRWWRDTDGINVAVPDPQVVHRTREGTAMVMIYPGSGHTAPAIPDGFGFGIEGELAVNGGYTVEAHGSFVYAAGQRLRFGSEDDLWVFVDHTLVHEAGGPFHGLGDTVLELDAIADQLGLVVGQTYDLDVFLADRGRSSPHHWFEFPTCG